MNLPILTLPDHKISGEGVLDPLGVATISDRLAEQVLPGLRARMARPRFLTVMAVCAAACDRIEDQFARDGTTLRRLESRAYNNEEMLQCLLAQFPDLLAGGEMGDAPKRWLFQDASQRVALVQRLNQLPGVQLPADSIDRQPSFPITSRRAPQAMTAFKQSIEWAIEQVKISAASGP
jgi:hypothetical protein